MGPGFGFATRHPLVNHDERAEFLLKFVASEIGQAVVDARQAIEVDGGRIHPARTAPASLAGESLRRWKVSCAASLNRGSP